jgi:hypothetical protein
MVSIFYESCGYLIHLEILGDGTKACRICDLVEIA